MKGALVLLASLAACTPDIRQNPKPQQVVVQFDPGAATPVVPTPNDLARSRSTGLIVVPTAPGASPAQVEFNQEYLGRLSGFPFESTASALLSGPVDTTTVTPQTVPVIDLTTMQPVAGATPAFDPNAQAIVVPPPGGEWTRAHQYAVAVIGGDSGVKGANGEPVVGSATWALVSSNNSLVNCPNNDLTSPDCTPVTSIIPSAQAAVQLEQLRLAYKPILDALAARGVPRSDIAVVWTYTIVDQAEVTFDPAAGVIPFPNNFLLTKDASGATHVALPGPTGTPPTASECAAAGSNAQLALICGLNSLDGFSTLAPPVSESSLPANALEQGAINPATLVAQMTVGLAPVASTAPAGERTTPQFTPCLNCLSTPKPDGTPQTSPQKLQWHLLAPLDEKTTYLTFVSGDVKDTTGKPVIATPSFALLRSSSPLVDGNGKSTVDVLTDAQAQQLEPARAAMAPLFDGLQGKGLPRANVVLASAFTTQSEATVLDQLRNYPATPSLMLPATPVYAVDSTAQLKAQASAAGVPLTAVGRIFTGEFMTALATTGPGGTLNPTAPQPQRVQFILTLPATPAPAMGYPVTVFLHGLTRWRGDVLAIANALSSAGQAVLSTDAVLHGDRSSCTGSASVTAASLPQGTTPSDDFACASPMTQKCDENPIVGRCVARDPSTRAPCAPADTGGVPGDAFCTAQGQGYCVATDMKCEGGDFARDSQGRPVISGWNILNLANFFATRDNFRQEVIDLAQGVRVIDGTAMGNLAAAGGTTFDASRVNYVGQSLGGILGTLYNAVSPDTSNVVLNVPGGTLPQIILTSPSFASAKQAFNSGLAAQGITQGTPAYDQVIGFAQWIVDPADPANMSYRLTHSVQVSLDGVMYTTPNAGRHAFVQFIQGDQTVPNPTTFALLAGAQRQGLNPMGAPNLGCAPPLYCYEFTEAVDMFDATTATPSTRHGFLLQPPTGSAGLRLTTTAQTQASAFVVAGALPDGTLP